MGREVVGDDWVPVEVDELESLREDSRFLEALEVAGVDNWEGYEVALQLYNGEIAEDEI